MRRRTRPGRSCGGRSRDGRGSSRWRCYPGSTDVAAGRLGRGSRLSPALLRSSDSDSDSDRAAAARTAAGQNVESACDGRRAGEDPWRTTRRCWPGSSTTSTQHASLRADGMRSSSVSRICRAACTSSRLGPRISSRPIPRTSCTSSSPAVVGSRWATATRDVRPRSIVFVAANVPHRFHDITERLELFVAFGPAEESRR